MGVSFPGNTFGENDVKGELHAGKSQMNRNYEKVSQILHLKHS